MKKSTNLLALLSLGSALHLATCNTMSGIGQDIQRGGQAIERSAR